MREDERGLAVCKQCLQTNPRCPACRLPLPPEHTGPCPHCHSKLLQCLTCGVLITGSYIKIGNRGPFCESCYQTWPPCATCGAPVGESGRQLTDGRHICPVCQHTAVYDETAARSLFEQVKAILKRELNLALNVPTPLYLTDRRQLEVMVARLGRGGPVPEKSLGFYTRQGRRRGIYILSGLPQVLLIGTMAHEYAHAWQGEHNPFGGDLLLWEGFAEWVAYKTMLVLGQTDFMREMLARPDLYGQGLRRMLEIENRQGASAIFKQVQRGKKLDTS